MIPKLSEQLKWASSSPRKTETIRIYSPKIGQQNPYFPLPISGFRGVDRDIEFLTECKTLILSSFHCPSLDFGEKKHFRGEDGIFSGSNGDINPEILLLLPDLRA